MIDNIVDTLIFKIEELLLFGNKFNIRPYLDFLWFIIKKYKLYEKIDIYLSFFLQLSNINKRKLRKILKWILSNVLVNMEDERIRSRIYYVISKGFLYLKQYNKAQNFAIKALKSFYRSYSVNLSNTSTSRIYNINELFYVEIYLLILRLSFYRRRYAIAYNLSQYIISAFLNASFDKFSDKNFIYLLLESFLWLIVCYFYVSKGNIEIDKVREVLSFFYDSLEEFKFYLDKDKIEFMLSSILLKNIDNYYFLFSGKLKRKNYKEIYWEVENLINKIKNLPNGEKFLLSLYKHYIITFYLLYPDNYSVAIKYLMKSFYLNYHYLKSPNLVGVSKFLLFKIMKLQNIYTNLSEYMRSIDIYEYINDESLEREVKKDISDRGIV
jgi:hypothetical protein